MAFVQVCLVRPESNCSAGALRILRQGSVSTQTLAAQAAFSLSRSAVCMACQLPAKDELPRSTPYLHAGKQSRPGLYSVNIFDGATGYPRSLVRTELASCMIRRRGSTHHCCVADALLHTYPGIGSTGVGRMSVPCDVSAGMRKAMYLPGYTADERMGQHATAGLTYPSSLTREQGKHLIIFCQEVCLLGAHEQMGTGLSDGAGDMIGTADRIGADLEHLVSSGRRKGLHLMRRHCPQSQWTTAVCIQIRCHAQ